MPRDASASATQATTDHLARARTVPDYLATLPSRVLQALMRDAPGRPLAELVNRRDVRIDEARHRIWRDVFWKGTFARDHLLGLDEWLMRPRPVDGEPYTGGRFWKRFDALDHGVATGLIVNYNLHLLPGRPEVREVTYPDNRRLYARAGDTMLLLTYLNQPYRPVYDLIKIVGPDASIGVMHLGRFPHGRRFATFVMARQNYPFELMTVPDHDALFESAATRAPRREEIGGRWTGRIVFVRHAERTMHNQFNPPWGSLVVDGAGGARLRLGLSTRAVEIAPSNDALHLMAGGGRDELRMIGAGTILGRRYRGAAKGAEARPSWRYVLRRPEGPRP
jgi:hypothetical protein